MGMWAPGHGWAPVSVEPEFLRTRTLQRAFHNIGSQLYELNTGSIRELRGLVSGAPEIWKKLRRFNRLTSGGFILRYPRRINNEASPAPHAIHTCLEFKADVRNLLSQVQSQQLLMDVLEAERGQKEILPGGQASS